MNLARPATTALTDLDAARAWLFDGLDSIDPRNVPLDDALGAVSAHGGGIPGRWPSVDSAAIDGYAVASAAISGASSYSPALLDSAPPWIETGQPMPAGCDCILEAECVDAGSYPVQVNCDAVPGQNVRRVGEDISSGKMLLRPGCRVTPLDLIVARRSGCTSIAVRRPVLRIIDIAANDGHHYTTALVADLATRAGADVAVPLTISRDAIEIVDALTAASADLVITIGGTGSGRSDATPFEIANCGTLFAHGLAIQPGRNVAVGRIGNAPVIALPGLPDQAIGAWLLLVEPLIDRLSGLTSRRQISGRLSRKISSAIGFHEIVLLASDGDALMPLATGAFSLEQAASADAWLAVPGGLEGYAAGTDIAAWPLRDTP